MLFLLSYHVLRTYRVIDKERESTRIWNRLVLVLWKPYSGISILWLLTKWIYPLRMLLIPNNLFSYYAAYDFFIIRLFAFISRGLWPTCQIRPTLKLDFAHQIDSQWMGLFFAWKMKASPLFELFLNIFWLEDAIKKNSSQIDLFSSNIRINLIAKLN